MTTSAATSPVTPSGATAAPFVFDHGGERADDDARVVDGRAGTQAVALSGAASLVHG